MKRWLPLFVTAAVFTVSFLLDIWSTSLFLGSPNCAETNPLFLPFSKTPFLLAQVYGATWFLFVGSSGYVYLANKRIKGSWWVELCWYWILWVSTYHHLYATGYNLSILLLCWA